MLKSMDNLLLMQEKGKNYDLLTEKKRGKS